jgi:hypothetical protein
MICLGLFFKKNLNQKLVLKNNNNKNSEKFSKKIGKKRKGVFLLLLPFP